MESCSLCDHVTISQGQGQSYGNRKNMFSSWEAGQCFSWVIMTFGAYLVTEILTGGNPRK